MKNNRNKALRMLNISIKYSPYIISIILILYGLYFFIPPLTLDIETFKNVLTEASWAGVGLAFLVGFIFSFNPVSFASVPVVLAYVTKVHEQRSAFLMAGAFVSGMILTHVVLGTTAALGGKWVQGIMGREWGLFLGPLLITMGLMWSGWLNLRIPWMGLRAKKVTGAWGAFLLGIPFTVAICPFCTPALLVTLTASAAIGSAGFGFTLLLSFALGRSIPVLLTAWSIGYIESLSLLSRYQKYFEKLSGLTLIITGLYLLNEYFFIF